MKILIVIMIILGSLKIGTWVTEYQFRERARKLEIIQNDTISKIPSLADLGYLFEKKVPVAPEEAKAIPNP
jgi:hypothetical protein